jgi:hypothetical protein
LTAARRGGIFARMTSKFGATAYIDPAGEFSLSPEERLRHSLANPADARSLTPRATTAITKARISYALATLAHGLQDEVQEWIRNVATTNPKQAVELYFELIQFSVPKLKAIEHTHVAGDTGKPMKDYTFEELQALASSVVSSQ